MSSNAKPSAKTKADKSTSLKRPNTSPGQSSSRKLTLAHWRPVATDVGPLEPIDEEESTDAEVHAAIPVLPEEVKRRKATMTFMIDEKVDFEPRKVTKVKLKNNSQEPSQEVSIEVVHDEAPVSIQKYIKPARTPHPESGILTIKTTPDECNPWADCSHLLKRTENEVKSYYKLRGPRQKALLNLFMPTIGKTPDSELVEEDWEKLIEFSKGNEGKGIVLIPGKTPETKIVNGETVTTDRVIESRITFYKETVCFMGPANRTGMVHIVPGLSLFHVPICNYPDCLSKNLTNFHTVPMVRCKQHQGVERFGVSEFYDEADDVISIFSSVFSYSVKVNSSEQEKLKFFQKASQQAKYALVQDNEYLASVNKTEFDGTMNEKDFGSSKEAEQYLATLQTSRLFAKMNGGQINGKDFNILNKESNLAYKCENDMEKLLHDLCQTEISCQLLTTTGHELPKQLGRRADQLKEGEGRIYMDYDVNVNYSGIKPRSMEIKSCKALNTNVGRYEEAMTKQQPERRERVRLSNASILINSSEPLKMTEDVVNLSNYIGHLYKLDNPLTGTDYVCLNKQVKTDNLIDNWHLVQGFVRHFYTADVSLSSV